MATQVSPSQTSPLNPNAALFIPSSFALSSVQVITHDDDSDDSLYQVMMMPEWDVEDFSPEWWNLVQTSPEFCEFWLHGYEAANDSEDFLVSIQNEDGVDVSVDEYTDNERDTN